MARIEALSPERRALVEKLLEQRRARGELGRSGPGPRVLSSAQRRLWFLHRLEPTRCDYALAGLLRLEGELDREALAAALASLLDRHEILRARVVEGDPPSLAIAPASALELPVRDEPGDARARALADQPFDLERGPLVRFELCRVHARLHELVIVAHHLICDGGSLGRFAEELAADYRSRVERGRPAELAPLPLQYADFAAWEQRQATSDEQVELERWWLARLDDRVPPPLVPARGSVGRELAAERLGFTIAPARLAELDARAAELAATRFALLSAALFAALAETWPRRELWIGTPVAGRDRAELRDLIGLFVNMVVIRARVDETTRIAGLCEAVRDELRAVLAHAGLPFERLVERLRPDREQGGTPLLQAAISLQEPAAKLRLADDLSARLEGVFTGRVTIELLLVLRPNDEGGLDAWFEYARDRFDAVAIAALVETYASALQACVAEPERALRLPAPSEAAIDPTRERPCSNLAPTQRAMWMGQRMHVDAPIYNQQMICRIDAGPSGPLDADRFARAFARVVAEHDALRTVIELHEGVPRQRALPLGSEPAHEQLRLAAGPEGEAAARALFRRRGARMFALGRGLLDSVLVWTGERCWWCLTLHHLITDGWSFALILERTIAAYRGLGEGSASASPDSPGSSFTALLESLAGASGPHVERARRHWQELPSVPPPAFFARRRDPEQTAVARVRVAIDAERSAALIRASSRAELRSITPALALANLFTTLAAGLVHRLSGERELCVGVPMHNRGSALAKQTIGALMVVCPIRVVVPERARFAGLAREVGAAMLDALKQLKGLDALRADRRPYDVMINYLDLRFAAFDELPTRVEMTGVGHALDTLTINVEEREGEFVFDLDLALDVFDAPRRAIVQAELERLIDLAIADFDAPLHGRPELAAVESAGPSEPEPGLWAAIEARARARPDAIAIVGGSAQLSWSALVRCARAWAEQLHGRGVGPGRLVAIALPRSPEQVVAILAVLACGGGYVPIDPHREPARLRAELALVEGGLILIHADQRERFAEFELEPLAIESLSSTPSGSPLPRPCPSAPVYAMHTSGTTSGRPNAVIVEQRGLINHARWASERFGLSVDDRVLQFADLGFDTAAEELFPTLLTGATLVLRDADTLAAPAGFWRSCRAAGVSVVDLPTAYWHVLVGESEPSPAQLGAVRLVVIGGERAERGAVARWQAGIAGACELLNTYGPTEATIVSTACSLRPDSLAEGRELAIGEPIPGHRAELIAELDFPARVLPEVPGELHIGGVGLATGYAGNPRLTAERFVPDPRGPAGARLYRTGDMVRRTREGQLEYLGRRDRQLKLRGVRIEPLGLERALLERSEVAGAAVVGTGFDRPGAARLWAFMVPSSSSPPPAASVVAGLAPPGVALRGEWIESLPLTARGKLDLDALRARAEALVQTPSEPLGAIDDRSSELEATTTLARLRGLWAELLACDAAGIGEHDDFFALGGHSLLGVMLMARITRTFGVELALRELFDHPRLAELAAAIERVEPDDRSRASEPLRPAPGRGARSPLSPAQDRLWFLDQLDPGNPTWNVPAAIELLGELDVPRLRAAFSALIRRHEILRTSFEIHAGEPCQVVHDAIPLAIPVTELGAAAPAELEARARAHAGQRFDLARGPLLAAELLRCEPGRHVLLLAVHHIVADGWSVGVLVRELWALLAALERGVDPAGVELELPPLPVQYADHAIWQRARLAGPAAREQRSWWRATLEGAPETIALPFDRPRPTSERHRGASLAIRLEPALVERLRAFARANEATPYMVCLAAFAATLAQIGKQTELCIGTPIAGRDDPASEGLIGFFVNTLVLRLHLEGNPTFTDLIRRVRATCLDAFARRETPFEAIVEDLRPQRSLARQPLFQVMFTFLNEPTRRELDGPSPLAWRVLEFDRGTANRDLTLRVEEREQGLVGHFEYNTDLFEPSTIAGWAARLSELLSEALAEPGKRIASLAGSRGIDERRDLARSRHEKFLAARARDRPRPRGGGDLFATRPLFEDRRSPLVFEARVRDLDPHAWLLAEREQVAAALERHGGVLLRGLPLAGPDEFARLCRSLTPDLMDYDEQSTPRTTLAKHVYTSTEYPAQSRIMPHNEMAYASHWPRWLWFYCRRPAEQGGESPLVDSALVRARIDAGLRERFEARGVCYMRNYRERLDLPWQRVFGTDDRALVEAHCRAVGTEFEWSADGGLRTWDRSPACAREPVGGELVWFNSAHMFHVSSLDPEVCASLRALFAEDALPRHAWFGDGSPIEDEAIAHVRQVYRDESLVFGWQRGDVLVIDNLRFAHGREPFTGPREMLVAMASPSADRALGEAGSR
ncbi:amino acid adenylation domain-containing protein [Nannocystaceae bacterium ST9]